MPVYLKEGVNVLGIGAMDAGLVLERIVLYGKDVQKSECYMGPLDSYMV